MLKSLQCNWVAAMMLGEPVIMLQTPGNSKQLSKHPLQYTSLGKVCFVTLENILFEMQALLCHYACSLRSLPSSSHCRTFYKSAEATAATQSLSICYVEAAARAAAAAVRGLALLPASQAAGRS